MEDSTFLYELALNPADGAVFSTVAHVGFVSAVAIGAWEVFDLKNTLMRPAMNAVSGNSQQSLPAPRGGM